jgi:hypothetical protein
MKVFLFDIRKLRKGRARVQALANALKAEKYKETARYKFPRGGAPGRAVMKFASF